MNDSDIAFNLSSALTNATGMPLGPAWKVIEPKPEIDDTLPESIYFLFVYDRHDPMGGVDDFVGGFSTLSLALKAYEQEKQLHPYKSDSAHIAILDDNGQLHIYLEYRDDHDFETLTISRGWKKSKPEEDDK